ncbi:specifically androgen-regulated gene protein isoform X1 [Vidua chalybeata]|uniref:specifically androgen-regulated gene protein isoform X1 n=2 Tax=Vidua chalybeata TaxID=81927 RepID=UPI0023A850A0|nr:specifically androgen-regulated gene protein isoform X1 [Vidua chalybeata]
MNSTRPGCSRDIPAVPASRAARAMPRKELGMAGCNSGSCDSMVSTASNHSQRSDNSYDYLSVEEKECLMFLEETIGSLDAEGDSGVSTDDTDYGEPSKPRKGPVPRDLGNGTPPPSRDQQRGAEQRSGGSISAPSGLAPAAAPGPGCSSLPRSVPAANGASGSTGGVHTVPAGKPAQEVPKEGRLDQGSAGSHTKSVMIHPPDPFQDDLEWSRSHRSDAKGEAAKETKIRTAWGQPEKSTLEEAPQEPDAKRGPPTAPKPRKLPPNIILKTSRNSPVPEHNQKVKAAPPASATSHPSPASDSTAEKGNSGHLDPKEKEKARREALEKLGLSQDRREPSAHLHPHPREPPLPVPGQPGEGSVPEIRQMTFKSNTLERSGVGLGSSMGSTKEQNARSSSSSLGKMSFIERLAPSFLRSRPRPASLGAGKDFAGLKEQEEKDKSSKRRSHPLPSFPRPPRSAVSVKISPKGAADENRREALKKLGLLKE